MRVTLRRAHDPHAHSPRHALHTVLSARARGVWRAHAAGMVAVPAGAVYVVPAQMPHALAAPEGDVVYQEAGTGPTATVPVGE